MAHFIQHSLTGKTCLIAESYTTADPNDAARTDRGLLDRGYQPPFLVDAHPLRSNLANRAASPATRRPSPRAAGTIQPPRRIESHAPAACHFRRNIPRRLRPPPSGNPAAA